MSRGEAREMSEIEFNPVQVEATPEYFLMLCVTVVMCLFAYQVGTYAYAKLKDMIPSNASVGESW